VIDDGVTGRIVSNTAEAAAALQDVLALSRQQVRATFERRFTSAAMAQRYVRLYESMIATVAECPTISALRLFPRPIPGIKTKGKPAYAGNIGPIV